MKFLSFFLFALAQSGKLKWNPTSKGIKYETLWIDQTVDHFSFHEERTYKQRYLQNSDFFKTKDSPIFFYTGNEGPIDSFAANTGLMNEMAERVGALIIYAEHRYYGESLPFGKDSFTKSNIQYLSVENALADFAAVIVKLRSEGKTGPVIAFGGSYGGLLSQYIRMQYPNLVHGALAASAPMFWISGMKDSHDFWVKVTSDFNAYEGCESRVREGFTALSKMAQDEKWSDISEIMRTCQPIAGHDDFMHMMGWARNAMVLEAMLDYPYPTDFMAPLPGYPIKEACSRAGAADTPADGIREAAGLLYNGTDPDKFKSCFDIYDEYVYCADPTGCGNGNEALSWDYQCCTQQDLPGGTNGVTDMFPVIKFDPDDRAAYCNKTWGVIPDRNWLRIKYWSDNLAATSNTIFSNGDVDPWGPGGVMKDIRKDLPAPIVEGGAHHFDLRGTNPGDTASVKKVRSFEETMIKQWIAEYSAEANSSI